MKNIILLLFLFLFNQFIVGQSIHVKDTIYIDEFKNQSSKKLTLKKCKSNVFYCDVIAYDSLIAYHVYHKFIFGRIEKSKLKQYHSILKNRMNVEVDSSSTIVIDYRKFLNNSEWHRNYVDSIIANSPKDRKKEGFEYDQKHFKYIQKKSYKRRVKCSKKIQKNKNTVPIYMYSSNKGADLNSQYYNRMKRDFNKTFQNNFFQEQGLYKWLILKPNGDYFLKSTKASQNDFSEKDVYNLLKNKNWEPFHKEWNIRLDNLQKTVPRVRIMRDYYKQEYHCF